MKSALETLSPTRVKLTVEVPFDELKPSVDAAYRSVARQIRVKGFRPGKVPPVVVDRQVGRGTVLDQAMQQAIPRFYGDAVRDNEVAVLGHPQVDVTQFADGGELVFTAEVDVRPPAVLPAYDSLEVTVEDAEVTDDRIDAEVAELQDGFATLTAVERPAHDGDYVTLDLSTSVNGQSIEHGDVSGVSYQVGSDSLIAGVDEVLVGMSEGDAQTFQTELPAGEYAGQQAEVSVTVRSVKVKEMPELDDDWAQRASEFDTLAELREGLRTRLTQFSRYQQGIQGRDHVLAALLDRVELPLPDSLVETDARWRRDQVAGELERAEQSMEDYLRKEDITEEEFNLRLVKDAQTTVKTQLVLDAIADAESIGVTEAELADQLVRRAQRYRIAPDQLAAQVMQNSEQLAALVAEVRRGKALATVLEAAKITDVSGRPVELAGLREDASTPEEVADPAEAPADARQRDAEPTEQPEQELEPVHRPA